MRSPAADGKILVLGGSGMLGHKMFQRLKCIRPDTLCTLRESRDAPTWRRVQLFQSDHVLDRVDVSDGESLDELLRDIRPAVTVNCIGVIKQRSDSQDAIASITVNALLPHRVARISKEWGGRVIHFSTDCVFSGRRGKYREGDEPDPTDIYGRTKQLGEITTENTLTLRTSFIGRELHSFQSLLEWFLAHNNSKVKGYRRVWWSGVTANHLSDVVASIIEDLPHLSGLYHLSGVRVSKYDLLVKIRDGLGLDIDIEPDESQVCDRSLDGTRFAAAAGYEAPSWDTLIAQLRSDPTPYSSWAGEHAHS